MKRVIYSVYVDVPAKEHYGKSKHKRDTKEKASITVNAFKNHYKRLIESKQKYADTIGVPFIMYEYDNRYQTFEKNFLKDFPELTGYEVINFYKIHLLCELAKEYDEILYLDFDALPVTKDSFFDAWDLSKGICVYNNNAMINKHDWPITKLDYGIRSPTGKYYNCQAMLIEKGLDPNNDVINTGIIGARKEDILKLNYFGDFSETIKLMTKLINDESGLYPQNIVNMFRYDNETIFSYKREVNNVNIQWFDTQWHYFFDKQYFIPKEAKIVHAVCKDFDVVWRYCEKHNL
jgi:hypothetical protein